MFTKYDNVVLYQSLTVTCKAEAEMADRHKKLHLQYINYSGTVKDMQDMYILQGQTGYNKASTQHRLRTAKSDWFLILTRNARRHKRKLWLNIRISCNAQWFILLVCCWRCSSVHPKQCERFCSWCPSALEAPSSLTTSISIHSTEPAFLVWCQLLSACCSWSPDAEQNTGQETDDRICKTTRSRYSGIPSIYLHVWWEKGESSTSSLVFVTLSCRHFKLHHLNLYLYSQSLLIHPATVQSSKNLLFMNNKLTNLVMNV